MLLAFATTVRGLENLLLDELISLGATDAVTVNAGVEFKADLLTIMNINLYSRIASRVMIQLGFGGYRNEQDIYKIALKICWDDWFNVGNTIKVSTTAIKSPLKSLDFITLKVKDAICDFFVSRVDARPSIDKANPDMRIYTFLTKDTATIYLDTSGDALFKRGYRQAKMDAPLRENLAAGLIKMSGWDKNTPLYDPMCGSGTILIEAACIAMNIAPGLDRNFAFEKFIKFDQKIWETLKYQAVSLIDKNIKLNIWGGDISKKAINIAEDNASYAQVAEYIQFKPGDFLDNLAPSKNGIIITNPPYGVRLDSLDNLTAFYPLLATHLKREYAGWDCYILSSDFDMPKLMRLKPSKKIPVMNGALDCRFYEFKIVHGSNRK